MRKYKLKDGLQAVKDAWFYGEDLLIIPCYEDAILVANNQTEKYEEEGMLDFKFRTFPGKKIYIKKSDFDNVDEYLNHLETNLVYMAENISSDSDKKRRSLSYLYLSQLAFAIRERIALEEMYATVYDMHVVDQKVSDYVEECEAIDRIYCEYHADKELTFEDHVVIRLGEYEDSAYHFCDELCAKRFILSGHLKIDISGNLTLD